METLYSRDLDGSYALSCDPIFPSGFFDLSEQPSACVWLIPGLCPDDPSTAAADAMQYRATYDRPHLVARSVWHEVQI